MDQAAPQAVGIEQAAHATGQALEALRWNWGDAYEIGHDDERGWWAKRRDGVGGYLTAADPGELRAVIYADHDLMPVPRDFDPGSGDGHAGAGGRAAAAPGVVPRVRGAGYPAPPRRRVPRGHRKRGVRGRQLPGAPASHRTRLPTGHPPP